MTNISCIFCSIIEHDLPARFAGENEECIAIWDLNPQAPIHFLVIPKEHIRSLHEMEASHAGILQSLIKLVQQLATEHHLEADGYRIVSNIGKHGGQTVDHLHIHLLGGRQMSWPPG